MDINQARQAGVSKVFLLFFMLLLAGSQSGVLAQAEGTTEEFWTVEKRIGRVFYKTRGEIIGGDQFGFYKDPGDCKTDILWLSFSSPTADVKKFEGQDVTILLNVDGKDFGIQVPLLSAASRGITHVMMFSNWVPEEQLIDVFKKGRSLKVTILEPQELQALLDIKEDTFSLKGFTAKRKEAEAMCKEAERSARVKPKSTLTAIKPLENN